MVRKAWLLTQNLASTETGSKTGKTIVSYDNYHYVQKEEFNGIEIGKIWSVWRAWNPYFPKAIGTWKISR